MGAEEGSMQVTHLCFALVVASLAVVATTSHGVEGEVHVMRAEDFLRQIHVKPPEVHALNEHDEGVGPFHAVSAHFSQHLSDLGPPIEADAEDYHEHSDLGESASVDAKVDVNRLSDAEQAALNLEAAQKFPETHARIAKLSRKIGPARIQLNKLRLKKARAHRLYERHVQLMTKPGAEAAEIKAESHLQELRHAETRLASRLGNAQMRRDKLGHELAKQEAMGLINKKAVLLYSAYKKKYHRQSLRKQSKFKRMALLGAEKAAKTKFRSFMATRKHTLRQKLEAANTKYQNTLNERNTKRALRQKRRALKQASQLAEMRVEEQHRVKAQAQAMFQEYVKHYEEAQEAATESDLGESASPVVEHRSLPAAQKVEKTEDDLGESASVTETRSSSPQPPNARTEQLGKLNDILKNLDSVKTKKPVAPKPVAPTPFGLIPID